MTTVKFGDRITITVSPDLVLKLEGMLTAWVLELMEKGDIDLERESMAMAQVIVGSLAEQETP